MGQHRPRLDEPRPSLTRVGGIRTAGGPPRRWADRLAAGLGPVGSGAGRRARGEQPYRCLLANGGRWRRDSELRARCSLHPQASASVVPIDAGHPLVQVVGLDRRAGQPLPWTALPLPRSPQEAATFQFMWARDRHRRVQTSSSPESLGLSGSIAGTVGRTWPLRRIGGARRSDLQPRSLAGATGGDDHQRLQLQLRQQQARDP